MRKNRRENCLSCASAVLACALVLSVCGCASHERGWIGGEYRVVNSFPEALSPRPAAGLLLVALGTNTPVYVAGLREGDVMLEVDHKPIKHLLDFQRQIDAHEPGTSLPISVWHDGKTLDCDVNVGRETFKHDSTTIDLLSLYTSDLHLWPTPGNPSVSLIFLGYKSESGNRAELGSVKNSYLSGCNPDYAVYDEGWRLWVVCLRVSEKEKILTQEKVSK